MDEWEDSWIGTSSSDDGWESSVTSVTESEPEW